MAAKDERKRAEVGSIIDEQWEVIRVLGEGAFGAVYEVSSDKYPGKSYALKVIHNPLTCYSDNRLLW